MSPSPAAPCRRSARRCRSRRRQPRLIAEVQSHLDASTVRAVAMQAHAGLRRGAAVRADRRAVHRAGGRCRARPTARRHAARCTTAGRRCPPARRGWPIHRAPPPLAAQTARDRGVRDRHQGDRPAGAAGVRRQGGDVRRRRRRQDRADDGTDPRHGGALPGISVFAGIGERSREGHELWSDMRRVRRAGAHRAGVRPDERAAWRALAGRPDGADHRRVFSRREARRTCCC